MRRTGGAAGLLFMREGDKERGRIGVVTFAVGDGKDYPGFSTGFLTVLYPHLYQFVFIPLAVVK